MIVNADDFGRHVRINEAGEKGGPPGFFRLPGAFLYGFKPPRMVLEVVP